MQLFSYFGAEGATQNFSYFWTTMCFHRIHAVCFTCGLFKMILISIFVVRVFHIFQFCTIYVLKIEELYTAISEFFTRCPKIFQNSTVSDDHHWHWRHHRCHFDISAQNSKYSLLAFLQHPKKESLRQILRGLMLVNCFLYSCLFGE